MAFSVVTNNRFDLFVDEDDEPDQLLTKQQRQAAAERQRKDTEKKSGKVTSSGRHDQGKGQTQTNIVRPASANSATVKATPSSGNEMTQVMSTRRDTGKRTPMQPVGVSQLTTARQDVTFRERQEPGGETRGGPSNTSRRGRGVRRGGSTPASDAGFDRFGKREFERHSGSDKTGLKPIEKRSGGGAHNWGNITDTVKDAEDAEAGTAANVTGDVTPLEDDDGEEGVRQLTLDEWKALQTGSRPRTTFNVRKPGEGCTSDPTWKKMEMLRKKHDEVEVDQSGQFDDADEESSRSEKSVVQIPVTFADSDRHAGRGRGRGTQQQRVASRPQPVTLNDLVPDVGSEHDFPSLS